MNWSQEMMFRAVQQNVESLRPTPEACEDILGYPRDWTYVGASGPEDAVYAENYRKTFGDRHCKKRHKALGNSAMPPIPMLLGCFIQQYESTIALPANEGIRQLEEGSMNNDSPASQVSGSLDDNPSAITASARSPSMGPEGNGEGGSGVIAEAEAYLRSFLSFPDGKYFLPLALFAALEHCWNECFDEVPYL
jgi:hypothetical protein